MYHFKNTILLFGKNLSCSVCYMLLHKIERVSVIEKIGNFLIKFNCIFRFCVKVDERLQFRQILFVLPWQNLEFAHKNMNYSIVKLFTKKDTKNYVCFQALKVLDCTTLIIDMLFG